MASQLLTPDMVTFKGLQILKNSLVMGNLIDRQHDKSFGVEGAKIGDTLRLRKPPRYIGREGAALQPEATVETSVTLTMDYLFGVDLEFSSIERTLSLDDYSNRVLKPAITTVANRIDARIFQKVYPRVYNNVGTPGTVPSTIDVYLSAGTKLDNSGAPIDEQRYMVTNSKMQATLLPTTAVYFNPNGAISEQYKKGRFGKGVLGFDWYMDQNAPVHTFGTYAGTIVTNGVSQTGSSLAIDGITPAATLKYGDTFTIGSVYAVNPQSRQSTGELQQFVVLNEPSLTDTGGAMTLTIDPPITPSGQFQTTDSAAEDGAAITITGSTGRVAPMGLAFHRNAITMATAQLELVRGVHECARATDDDTGLSMRLVTAYDIRDNKMYTRLETLVAIVCQRPELACRVYS